jgi:hypothetical protein
MTAADFRSKLSRRNNLGEKHMSAILGSGEHRYRVVENWAKLPAGWKPGLWFIAGALAQCWIGSKYLALQIKAIEEGALAHGS